MEPIIGGATQGADGAALIKNGTTASFMADVIEASRDAAVVVDFWAPWCGPCKQLGPMLEKSVRDARGKVRMVKINVDENQELAAQMRIQSIPAVYAFKDGRPVDAFVGAVPESQIKQFIQKLGGPAGPSPVEEAMAMAKEALQNGDHDSAGGIFSQVLQREAENIEALAGLARVLIAKDDHGNARQLLSRVPTEHLGHSEIAAAHSALEVAEQAKKAMGEAGKYHDRLAADANDHEARFELATALFGAGQREEGIDELLTLYQKDRAWNDEAARKQLVKFFEVMGPTDPLTLSSRRRLSSLMFS